MTSFYLSLWPVGAATVVIAIGAVSALVHNRRRWFFMSLAATLVGVLLYAPTVLAEAADPAHNRLHRDVAGAFVYAIAVPDRKSTRLNSSHSQISYAVFCL